MNDLELIEEARRVNHDLARNALGERVPVIDVLADRLQDLLAEVRAAALAEQGETEWEYGRRHVDEGGSPHVRPASDYQGDTESPDGHRADGSPYWNYTRVRRRKAGPWMPVEGEAG